MMLDPLQLKGIKGSSFGVRLLRGHKQPITAVRISDDETTIYSASKDCCIVKWDVETGNKLAVYRGRKGQKDDISKANFPGHDHQVFALALTSDGKYLASGGKDKTILIWDTAKNSLRDGFKGHKDSVTALAFRLGSHDLYSGSDDRTLKMWNVDEMSYMDTLFGHKAEITAIDALTRERPVTSSLDKTAAVWKVVDEVHLEYFGPKTHLFSIALLNEDIFVTGGQNGSIHLWSSQKRKPIFEYTVSHGDAPKDSINWITSLAALRYSDLFASGSGTGEIRLWKLSDHKDSFTLLNIIPVPGIINCLQFSKSGKYLIAGIGQEPRMGRWVRIPEARNGTAIIQLQQQ
jgi:ribosomal RNA-processing protein 9